MAASRSETSCGGRFADGNTCGASDLKASDGNGDQARLLERINSFSLVSYIPGELGDFLTGLREELVPGCVARAHVTVLPPRPLALDSIAAKDLLGPYMGEYSPFLIELPRVRIFEETAVVFIDIGAGRDTLLEMHDDLSQGPFAFAEPYPYHPHVTIAQGIARESVPEIYEAVVRRWNESAPSRSYIADKLTFVQNTLENRWLDLACYELGRPVALPVG